MKRPAIFVLILLLLAFISIYFIVPQNIRMVSTTPIYATDQNVFNFLIKKKEWPRWWPGAHKNGDVNSYTFNGVNYTLQQNTNSDIAVLIKSEKIELDSRITYLATDDGMTTVTWEAGKQSSLNPFERIAEFVRIKDIQHDVADIMDGFKQFMQTDTNVYGIKVRLQKVKDSVMIATHVTTTTYPTTKTIYNMVDELRNHIKNENGKETNQPMLNINQTDENEYHTMVAIPVAGPIKPAPGMVINKMVAGGNILETEVKGGRKTIDNAFVQMKNYLKDHGLVSPAMPFELMVTNRLTQPDTTKWITKVYYPIF
ncbi:GyrI-like domain-containing protein [Mucilaginibacter segetis]|uniref:GyrI-like domain-containing protein n=1 Tax=Mucilaginibacter segetis TaxID=2793071 RepID=A0A934UM11_9SPHI|nr:GyrI-like domain-containing protein [Mucilaginibacter segetis]MBK0378411.1 GyrI-like domain-containing protein [Mucilaginibacter segetis]